MAIKAIIFTDPDCKKICADAVEAIKATTGQGEVEIMEINQALQQGYDLGEPEGVPFLGFVSESTRKCINKAFFHDEDGKIVLQRFASEAEDGKRKLTGKISHINPQTGEDNVEADQG